MISVESLIIGCRVVSNLSHEIAADLVNVLIMSDISHILLSADIHRLLNGAVPLNPGWSGPNGGDSTQTWESFSSKHADAFHHSHTL